jgi:hypothetical protein
MASNQPTEDRATSSNKLLPWIVNPHPRDAAGAIRAGLDALFALRREAWWGDASNPQSIWTTAKVLGSVAELSAKFLTHSRRQDIQHSLDCLTHAHHNGCWQDDNQRPDCLSTAMAVIALRCHGRSVPPAALRFLESCRVADGGFAASPGQHTEPAMLRALAITATASRALEYVHPSTEKFLIRNLGAALPVPGSCNAFRFYVCSEILDWPAGQASMQLLSKVSQLTIEVGDSTALGQALLLRSLLRLGIARSWPVAARLREMQAPDGSWYVASSANAAIHPADGSLECANQVVVIATALSALALAESQPGLYFGSDLPLPQRF